MGGVRIIGWFELLELLLQVTDAEEPWQRGYKSLCFLAHDTTFSNVGLASTKHGRSDNASQFSTPWQANVVSWVSTCAEIVKPFKHLLRVTAHPQCVVLELWTPMGEHPWVIARDNTVPLCFAHMYVFCSSIFLQMTTKKLDTSSWSISGNWY